MNVDRARKLMQSVCEYYGMEEDEIRNRYRPGHLSDARHVYCYLAYNVYRLGTQYEIGKFLGGRDHTSVYHGCKKITGWLDYDKKINSEINAIKTLFENSHSIEILRVMISEIPTDEFREFVTRLKGEMVARKHLVGKDVIYSEV